MFQKLLRASLLALRALFILLMLVIPIPVGELFHKLLDRGRRNHPAQVKKEE
jgi:hypothetical protein